MQKFMQTYKIFLTPLSPIHIGCGEDFEPTNYIIDNQTLYNFDPSHLNLSEKQQQDLLVYSNRLDLLAIQHFFIENKQKALEVSDYVSNVAQGVATDYQNKVGKVVQREKNDNAVFSKLAIERTSFLPYQNEPYIPGSSFKGALATAILDFEHKNNGNPKVNKNDHSKLLKKYIGEFANSKLRTVKFSDFTPTKSAHSKIYYSLNYKKRVSLKGKGITTRRECIIAGQYQAFMSELTLWKDKNNTCTIQDYFKYLNEYYKPIFKEECNLLIDLGLVSAKWVSEINYLLETSRVALIRLGKNGGDSKIYQGKNIAQIKIMRGKGNKPDYQDRATTVWLAGEQENQKNNLYPFGWALLQLEENPKNDPLQGWCNQQLQSIQLLDKQKLRQQKIEKLSEIQTKQKQEEQKRLELEKQRQAEEQQKQDRLNSATENQKTVILLKEKIEKVRERQIDRNGSPLLQESLNIMKDAIHSWSNADKSYLKENITMELLKSKIDITIKVNKKELEKLLTKLDSI